MSDSRSYSVKRTLQKNYVFARRSKAIMFFTSIVIAFALTYFTKAESFNPTQIKVLFLLYFAILLWVTEAILPFAVGILIVGYLVFTMGNNPEIDVNQYVQTWSDGVIWIFLGGFFLAAGMQKTKLDEDLLHFTLPKLGNKAPKVLLGLMFVTAAISSLMSNTATTAMMIATTAPLILEFGKKSGFSKALLLGIPTAASFGGMATIIGSSPNAIAVGALQSIGIQVSFIDWILIGTPAAIMLTWGFWKVLVYKFKLNKIELNTTLLTHEAKNYSKEEKNQKLIVLLVLSFTLVLWLSSKWTGIPNTAISGIPIIALTMLGIIDADDVRTLPWDTLMLVAGGLALGLAIEEQQIPNYYISFLSNANLNFYLIILIFGFITVLISNFMSNTAATTILIPIAISLTKVSEGANPMILPIVIGLCASCALLLPVSTPPNAIAFSTKVLKQQDFKTGGIFGLVFGPVLVILLTLLIVNLFL